MATKQMIGLALALAGLPGCESPAPIQDDTPETSVASTSGRAPTANTQETAAAPEGAPGSATIWKAHLDVWSSISDAGHSAQQTATDRFLVTQTPRPNERLARLAEKPRTGTMRVDGDALLLLVGDDTQLARVPRSVEFDACGRTPRVIPERGMAPVSRDETSSSAWWSFQTENTAILLEFRIDGAMVWAFDSSQSCVRGADATRHVLGYDFGMDETWKAPDTWPDAETSVTFREDDYDPQHENTGVEGDDEKRTGEYLRPAGEDSVLVGPRRTRIERNGKRLLSIRHVVDDLHTATISASISERHVSWDFRGERIVAVDKAGGFRAENVVWPLDEDGTLEPPVWRATSVLGNDGAIDSWKRRFVEARFPRGGGVEVHLDGEFAYAFLEFQIPGGTCGDAAQTRELELRETHVDWEIRTASGEKIDLGTAHFRRRDGPDDCADAVSAKRLRELAEKFPRPDFARIRR